MQKFLIIIIAFLFCPNLLFSQKEEETIGLIQKAKTELYINPEQSLKITEYILHNYKSNTVLVQSNSLLANYYFITGKYTLAVNNIMLAVKQLPEIQNKDIQIETLLLAAEIFNFLDLYEASQQYIAMAKKTVKGDAELERKLKNYELLYSKGSPTLPTYRKIIKWNNPNEIINYASLTKGTVATQLTEKFLDQEMTDSAFYYSAKNIANLKHHKLGIYWEMIAEIHHSDCFFKSKDYQHAVAILNSALQKESTFKNSYFEAAIYAKLAKNYLVLKNNGKYLECNRTATALSNILNNEKTYAVNAAFDKLQIEKAENIIVLQEKENRVLWIMGLLALCIVLGWLFIRWQYRTRITYTSNIVNYLKLIKDTELKPETPEKLILKSNQRPKETDELLLSKLAKFETGNKYLSNDISLAQLASQFDTNTKYLSEVINQYKGKNFNVYINELRIHYIVNKLKTDPIYLSYKVSYLAEECGFSTHSSFSTVFKSITGITPNVFIQFLTQDKIEGNVFSLN